MDWLFYEPVITLIYGFSGIAIGLAVGCFIALTIGLLRKVESFNNKVINWLLIIR